MTEEELCKKMEEFRSRYIQVDLKCKRCGEIFKRYFGKDITPGELDLYTREGAPVFCDECLENYTLEELLGPWE